MAGTQTVPGCHGQFRFQPGGGQRQLHGAAGHGGRVVLLAQVGQDDVGGAVFRQRYGEAGGGIVAEMTLAAQNALLQIVGIGAGLQSLHIVVGLQKGQVHTGQSVRGFFGDISGVRQQAHAAVRRIKAVAAGAGSVMGGGKGGDRAAAQIKSDVSGKGTEPFAALGQPEAEVPGGVLAGEDGEPAPLQQGL